MIILVSLFSRDIPRNDLVSEHQYTEPSGVHYTEEDDEDYGNEEVPYVWDEGDEDESGKDLDHAIYLRDDEEAEEEGYES